MTTNDLSTRVRMDSDERPPVTGDLQEGGLRSTTAVQPSRRRMPRRLLVMVGVVLAAALVAGASWAFLGARAAQARETARTEALASARHRLPLLLSYGYRTLSHDQSVELAQTTGRFHDDYARLLAKVVKPAASAKKISTSAEVSAAAVVSGDADRVVVLAFITQSTTSPGQPRQVTGSRVNVTLVRSAGGWKISGLDPV